jgi:hypothetical protein
MELSTNYLDYLTFEETDSEDSKYIKYRGDVYIAGADWNDRKRLDGNISYEEMTLYLIVTDKDAKFYENEKFLSLTKSQKEKVIILYKKYVTYYKTKSLNDMIEEQKMNLLYLDNSEITYDHIKKLDWNNKQEVPTSLIVNAFKNDYGNKEVMASIVEHVLTLNSKRIDEINNTFGKANIQKHEKDLWKAHALEMFEHSELSKLLDDGDVQLFITEQYIRLYTTVLKRGLPLEDKNASKQDEPFYSARSTMMDLLARTGKLKEARQVMLMTLDSQPDTLSSYIDEEIRSLEDMLADKFKDLTPTKITKICRTLKDLIKDNYIAKYTAIKEKLKEHPDYTKTKDTELNRSVGFMLGLDIQITLAKERKKQIGAQLKSKLSNRAGLGLAQMSAKDLAETNAQKQ